MTRKILTQTAIIATTFSLSILHISADAYAFTADMDIGTTCGGSTIESCDDFKIPTGQDPVKAS